MRPVDRGLAAESDNPKYAHTEFERRWLVDTKTRPAFAQADATDICDRYITNTRLRLRRMERRNFDDVVWKLTKKYDCAEPSARPIVTTYMTHAEYQVFYALPASELVKRRLHVEHAGNWWSLDLFDGALSGLEIVECEAADANALGMLVPPPWALQEVTDVLHWQGGALATHGIRGE